MPCCAIAAFIAAQVLAFSQRLRARLFGGMPRSFVWTVPRIPRRLMAVVLAGEIALGGAWLLAHSADHGPPASGAAFCLAGGR